MLQSNVAGGLTLANQIGWNGGYVTFSSAGTPITLANPLSVGNILYAATGIVNNNATVINESLGGQNALTLLAGTGTLSVSQVLGFNGALIIGGGALSLTGASGAVTNTSGIQLDVGGTLVLDNTSAGGVNSNRINVPLSLGGGTLSLLGNSSAATTENVGAVTFASGTSTINVTPGTGFGATLNAGTITSSGGTVNYTVGNSATLGGTTGTFAQVKFSGGESTSGTVYGNETVNGTGFATYTANGITSTATSGTVATGANLLLSGNTSIPSNVTSISSLAVSGNTTVTIPAGQTLTITSGGLMATGGGQVTIAGGGTLVFGTSPISLTTDSNIASSLAINTPMTGSGGLGFAGAGTITLNAANTALSGAIVLDGPTVVLGAVNAINTTGTLTLAAGTLATSMSSGILFPNPVTLNNSNVTLGGSTAALANPLYFGNNVTLNGANDIINVPAAPSTNPGFVVAFNAAPLGVASTTAITGSGMLTKTGSGALILAGNASTYTGQVNVNAGTIQVQAANGLGASGNAYVASGGAITIRGTGLTVPKALFLNGSGPAGGGALENLEGANNTVSGAIMLVNSSVLGASLGADAGTTLTLSGVISGPADLTKVGVGTIVLSNNANSYFGETTLAAGAGILQATAANALGQAGSGVVVQSGATLEIQGTITVPSKPLTLNGTGFGNYGGQPLGAFAVSANNNTWVGNVTLVGATTLTSGSNVPLLSPSNAGTAIGGITGVTLTLNGTVSGSDLTKIGANTLTLTAPNTYTGQTIVMGGTLTLQNSNAATGPAVISGAPVNGAFTAGQLTMNNLGSLAAGSVAIDEGGTLLLDNSWLDMGGSSAAGTGELNNPTAKPTITMNAGTLTYYGLNAQDAAPSEYLGNVVLQSGQSTIDATNGTIVTGVNTTVTAATTAAGALTEVGNTVTLTATNTFQIGQTVVITGAVPATYNGVYVITAVTGTNFSFTSPLSGLTNSTANGTATLVNFANPSATSTLNLASLSRATGATVNFLGGPTNYTPLGSVNDYLTSVGTIAAGGTFTLTVGGQTTAAINATLTGPALLQAVQTALGALTNINVGGTNYNGVNANGDLNFMVTGLNNSSSLVISPVNQLAGDAVPLTLTMTNVTGGALAVSNGTVVGNQILIGGTSLPTYTGNQGQIIPSAKVAGLGGNGDFATTYTASNGATGITAFQNYLLQIVTTPTATLNGGAGDIVKVAAGASGTATITAKANQTLGALLVQNSNTATTAVNIALNPTQSLTLASGELMTVGNNVSANTVSLGTGAAGNAFNLAGETILFQDNQGGGNTNFNGLISGWGSLVISGTYGVYLASASNTFTGGTVLNSGTLIPGGSGNFSTGPVTLIGGTFQPNSGLTFSNAFVINGALTIAGNTATITGPTTLAGNALFTMSNNISFYAPVGGPGAMVLASGSSTLSLDSSNTYSGGTILAAGSTQLGANTALGTGTLTFVSGWLLSNDGVTIPNAVTLPNTVSVAISSVVGQGNTMAFTGPVNLIGNNTLTVCPNTSANSGENVTFTGAGLTGTGALTLAGNGIVQLPTANSFSGGLTISGNTNININNTTVENPLTVIVGDNASFGTGTVTGLNAGTIEASSAVTLANPLLLNANSGYNIGLTVAGDQPITFAGQTILYSNSALTVNNSAATTLGGIGESGGQKSLTVFGSSALSLPSASYYSAGTILNPLSGPGVAETWFPETGASTIANTSFNGGSPSYARLVTTINYPNANMPTQAGAAAGINNVGAQWTGYLNVLAGGSYTFSVVSDDANQLFIDGQLVVNAGVNTQTGSINLAPGLHTVKQWFVNGTGGYYAVNSYLGPDTGNAMQLIQPATALSTPGLVSFSPTSTILNLGNNGSLGSGGATFDQGVVNATSALTLPNNLTFAGTPFAPVAFAGANMTFNGTVALTNATGISVNNTTTFTGVVSGAPTVAMPLAGSLSLSATPVVAGPTTYTGNGTLMLQGADTYAAGTTVNAGTLDLNGAAGALMSAAPVSAVQTITFGGTVTGGTFTLSFNGEMTQPIAYSATAATLQANILAALVALPNIGAGNVAVSAASPWTVTFQGALANTAQNTMYPVVANAENLTGTTPTVVVATTTVGTTNAVTVNAGGTLTLDNTLGNLNTRLATTAPVALNGGTFNLLGNSGTATATTFTSGLTLASGNSTINVTNAGKAVALTFASLSRNAGATVSFTAGAGQTLGSANNQVLFTMPPTLINGILKGATTTDATSITGTITNTSGYNLAAYGTTGITALGGGLGGVGSYTALTTAATTATGNYLATASTVLAAGDSVNALLVVGNNVTLSGASGNTLTLGSGTLAVARTGDIVSVPTLALGSTEGVFLTANSATATIASAITGTAGMTVGGLGSLSLTGLNSGLSGANAVQTITFNGTPTGGTFSLSFNGATTAPITYTTVVATLDANIQAALAALPTIGSTANVTVGGTATAVTVTFGGALTGAGQNLITVALNALSGGSTPGLVVTNSTAGVFATTLDGGTLSVAGPNSLAAGGLMLTSGTFQAAGTLTNEVAFNGQNATATIGGANPMVLSGQIVLGEVLAGLPAGSAYLADGNNVQLAMGTSGVTISGLVSGNANLDVNTSGAGVLTLTGQNLFTGETNIEDGIVNVQSGSVATTILNDYAGSTAVTESGSTVTFTGANTFIAGETVVIATVVPAGYTGTFVVTSATAASFTYTDGTTGLAAATTQGTANLISVPLGSAWAQPTTGALGPAGGGTVVANGGTLQLQSPVGISLAEPMTFEGSGLPGAAPALESVLGVNTLGMSGTTNFVTNFAGPATIAVDTGSLSQVANSDLFAGPGDVTKTGGGTLIMQGNNYQYGQVNVNNGILQAGTGGSQFALGSPVGTLVVNSGASLQFNVANGTWANKSMVLNGTGYAYGGGAAGANPNLTGALTALQNATLEGNITLNPGASIGTPSGVTITLVGIIGGTGNLDKVGTGQLNLWGGETYTGNTNVEQGVLAVYTGSTILNSPAIAVDVGATFRLDNNASYNNPNRVSDTASVTLEGGTFQFAGNPGAGVAPEASSETVGSLILLPGTSTVLSGVGGTPVAGSTAVMTFANVSRQTGAAVNFQSSGFALDTVNNRVVFTAAPATVGNNGGILPYATVNNADFASYDTINNSIVNFTGYVTSMAAAGPNDIVKLTGPDFLSGNKTIVGLFLVGGSLGLNGNTLTLSSGAVAASASVTIIGGTLNFGSSEGILLAAANTLTVGVPLVGSSGVTIGGGGSVTLPSASPALSGTATQALAGTLTLGNSTSLGTGAITLKSGTLQALAAIPLNLGAGQ